MSIRTIRLVSALALMIVLLAGCAGQTSTSAGPVETAEVTMPPSYKFDPPVIQVPAGTTVTWRNSDNFTHSVSITGGQLPVLNLSPGQSGRMTFDQPGTYAYICTYHAQNMQGTVIVVAG
jgi:plastocyanin